MESLEAGDPRYIGVYRLHSRLGVGGMGRVYLGFSPAGRAVAVKVIRPEFARDPEFVRRFRREVQAAEAVSGAFTAPVVSAGPGDDPPWLATAFVPGPSLAEVIALAGPLPEPAVRRLAGGLIEALQAVHVRGLVHRDLKPANVLLADDGPRVIDFGISRALEGTGVTATGVVAGTPGFLSPEQAEGLPVGPPSDVFALGSVIAFAATAASPFGSGEPVVMAYRVVHSEPDLSGVPAGLRELVASCLAKDPARRPALTWLLNAIVAGSTVGPGIRPGSFWPEPVAGLVSSRLDSFRASAPFGAGFVAGLPSSPSEPAAPGARENGERTRTAYDGRVAVPADTPATGSGLPPARRSARRRRPIIAAAAALAGGAVIGTLAAAYSFSSKPARSPSHVPSSPAPATSRHSAPPAAAAQTTVLVCAMPAEACSGSYGSQYMKARPARITNTADGSGYVKDISWSGWGTATARGRGILEVDNCTPNCAQGMYRAYPATVILTGLSPYVSGTEAYSTMVISAPTADQGHYSYDGLVP